MLTDTIIGTAAGIITGIVPGIHPNTIAILAGARPSFVVAAALSHTVSSIIPLVYLSTPAPDLVLASHPAAQLKAKGFGYEAVKLFCTGCLIGIICAALLTPVFILLLPLVRKTVQPYIAEILIATIMFLILYEKTLSRKVSALLVFFFAGILGLIALNSDINEPLLPLFTGLFGMPALLANLVTTSTTKPQHATDIVRPSIIQITTAVIGSIFSVIFLTLLPAISVSQSSVFATLFLRIKKYNFLVLLGSIAALDYYFSLLFAALFARTRNGIYEIVGPEQFALSSLPEYIAIMLFATAAATFFTLIIAKKIRNVSMHQNKLSAIVIIFLMFMAYWFSGSAGILLLSVSAAIGILPILFGVSRTHLMGCLIVPYLVRVIG